MPCSAAKRIALVIRSSIFSRSTPIALSFKSEIGDSITDAGTPSSTRASRSAGTAREKPQTCARRPAPEISSTASQSSCETLGIEDDADGLLAVAECRVVETGAPAHAVGVVQRPRPDLGAQQRTTPSGNA